LLRLRLARGVPAAGNAYGASLMPPNGAQQVCADTPLAITFDAPPQVGSAGAIRVFRADATLAEGIDLADSARRPNGGVVSDNGTVHLFNFYPVIVAGNTALIYLHHQLDYGPALSFTLPNTTRPLRVSLFPEQRLDAWRYQQCPDRSTEARVRSTGRRIG